MGRDVGPAGRDEHAEGHTETGTRDTGDQKYGATRVLVGLGLEYEAGRGKRGGWGGEGTDLRVTEPDGASNS